MCVCLLLHRPSDCMHVIVEFHIADRRQPVGAFAGGVVCEEFVGGSEVAGLAGAAVVMSGIDLQLKLTQV